MYVRGRNSESQRVCYGTNVYDVRERRAKYRWGEDGMLWISDV